MENEGDGRKWEERRWGGHGPMTEAGSGLILGIRDLICSVNTVKIQCFCADNAEFKSIMRELGMEV